MLVLFIIARFKYFGEYFILVVINITTNDSLPGA